MRCVANLPEAVWVGDEEDNWAAKGDAVLVKSVHFVAMRSS